MAIQRKPPPVAAPAATLVDFLSLALYAGGFTLPEGDYALTFQWAMERQHEKMGNRTPRLGVLITAYPLHGGEPQEQWLSAGRKAHDSFTPWTGNDGKSLAAIPGGAGGQLARNTNWMLFLKSLYDCGLPENVGSNDFTPIDGVWVHTANVPEPEERKGYGGGAKTGEAEAEEPKGGGLIPTVTEIKEGGKPWEGTGGIPAEAPAAAPTPVARPGFKPPAAKPTAVAPRAVARPVAVAAPVVVEGGDEEAILAAAIEGMTKVLDKTPDGTSKMALRTGTFRAVTEGAGGDMAQAVLNTFFGTDDGINSVLGQLGYKLEGAKVTVA